jgi:hypothetical protein
MTQAPTAGTSPALIGMDTAASNYLSFYVNNSQNIVLLWFDGSTKTCTGNTIIPLNTWAHIAVSVNANAIQLYVNGVAQTLSGTTTLTNRSSTTNAFTVGLQTFSTAYQFYGYLSNVRVVSGASLYNAGFTPPTSALGIAGSGTTTLLTCQSNSFVDNSSSPKALTVSGTPSVQPFAPFAPQFQYTQSGIGGSGFFDGNGDFLGFTNNASTDLGTGDFTFEFWVYPSALNSFNMVFAAGGANHYLTLLWGATSSVFGLNAFNGAVSVSSSTLTTPINQWVHAAFVRISGTLFFYINGVASGSGAFSGQFGSSTGTATLGFSAAYPGAYFLNGYMSNIRLLKGIGVYTGSFTPPRAPLLTSGAASAAAYPSTTNVNTTFATSACSLLTQFTNGGIIDGTMDNVLETLGNAQVSTSVVKYGSGSMYFDGSGDRLFISPNQNLAFGSGDFTVECWAYTNSLAASVPIICFGDDAASNGLLLYITTSGRIAIYGNNALLASGTTQLVTTGSWFHLAMSRSGTSLRLFVNGINDGTATNSTSFSSSVLIGAELFTGSIGAQLFGYLDDFRITKGVARYLSNFTPPQVALPRQ